ncbi:MAG: cation diffusion facilitator family transporter [Hyphomicrobium sp.]|uniref:cation diffusion facilitator family transporter n=1 Tax=Hyphomicrobium sp. TaxID=82 RepID=UPI001322478F|nr:cation diffusion facilitator family transporter [Hyphomicrobium sp.]KAB2941797.1 MAG: cation transporter [Hyphomicrobium sp.]MBZ0211592.1 cation diffusion facilitator family transporter [Hyphomicrobium sp.]
MKTPLDPSRNRHQLVAAVSIAVAVAVMGIKYVAFLMTGSVALFSDAMESIVNVLTAVAALIAIRIGAQPPDRGHPFGHHKAEYFAAVLEGALIIVAAMLIFHEAYQAFTEPRALTQPVAGLAVNGLATAINAAWAWVLISRGRAWSSPALEGDGHHLFTDVVTSVGVLIGLVLATLTGWNILDPLLAGAVAINILRIGYNLAVESMSMLMDQAASPEIEARIKDAIRANGEGALQAHDIRTRTAGPQTFIEFHLVVPGEMTVKSAHDICDRLEEAIEKELENTDVVIHVEPEHKAKRKGAVEL